MIRISPVLAAIALIAASGPALAGDTRAKAAERGETELTRILKDRVAGKPVSCLSLRDIGSSQIVNDTAIVYESHGTLYLNRPINADALDNDDILVTRTVGSQLCRMDSVGLVSRVGRFQHGFVTLNDFVPYAKAARPKG